ncbi:MAG: hypothetical protein AAF004_10325 [Pseudomonadota bacterium]
MKSLILTLTLLLTANAYAEPQLPTDADWYLHVAFDTMRDSRAAKPFYEWLQDEAIDDIEEELRLEFDKEVDRITAYGTTDGDVVAVISGQLNKKTQDKILRIVSEDSDVQRLRSGGVEYYHIAGLAIDEKDLKVDSDDVYFSFANKGTIVFGTSEKEFKAALRKPVRKLVNVPGAMLVLTADKELIQGGVNTSEFDDDHDFSFNSKLLSKTRQIAFVISDSGGDIDLKLSITADDPEATNSLANVVRGLIGLQALAGDSSTELNNVLSKLQIDNDSRGLTLRLVTTADSILNIVD